MFDRIRQLLAPPVFEGDEDKTRVSRLLNAVLFSFLLAMAAYAAVAFLLPNPEVALPLVGTVILLGLSAWYLMRQGRIRLAGLFFSTVAWMLITLVAAFFGGVGGPAIFAYVVIVIIAGVVLGGRAASLFAGVSIVAGLALAWAEISGFLPASLSPNPPIAWWAAMSLYLMVAAALLRIATDSLNEALSHARDYATELEGQRASLEETVAVRTADLERRTRYLEATTDVARDAASMLELDELLVRTARLVSQRFGFYHTGIFLLDPAHEWVVLQAASSEGGQRMLSRGHRLHVGTGIVGYAASQGEPHVASDVGEDAVFFDNPDLPDTRSEVALPLRARGEVIGVLDVQSREAAAFREEDVAVLQTLAGQVAVAIDNARLFHQAQQSLEAERRAYGELTREAWKELLRTRPDLGYRYIGHQVMPVGEALAGDVVPGEAEHVGEELPGLSLPITHLGQKLGTLVAHKPSDAGEWTLEEIELMETLAERLSVALEGARLYQDTQRRAARDRLLGEVTARVRETLDMDTVLQTAIREIGQALDLAEVEVRMGESMVPEPAVMPTPTGGNGREEIGEVRP